MKNDDCIPVEEFTQMTSGLRTSWKYERLVGYKRRMNESESVYGECLVGERLADQGYCVKFSYPECDLIANNKNRIEVKTGILHDMTGWSGASFGKGKQIKRNQFDYCVLVVIKETTLKPGKFFVFNLKESKDCATRWPRLTTTETPCILFYCEDFNDLVYEAKKEREPVFRIERKLHKHPKQFENRWDKIPKS